MTDVSRLDVYTLDVAIEQCQHAENAAIPMHQVLGTLRGLRAAAAQNPGQLLREGIEHAVKHTKLAKPAVISTPTSANVASVTSITELSASPFAGLSAAPPSEKPVAPARKPRQRHKSPKPRG
jgi:hypothetical protein